MSNHRAAHLSHLWGDPLRIPAVPQPIERSPFPVIASVAPVVAAGVIWAITQSPFVLLFALLGPVVAIAGVLDGQRQARRRLRKESARFAAEVVTFRLQLAQRHSEERRAAWQRTPAALTAEPTSVEGTTGDNGRWKHPRLVDVALGRGAIASSTAVDLAHSSAESSDADTTARSGALQTVRELRAEAAVLLDAPVSAIIADGIAIVGAVPLATSALRGLIMQMARATPPSGARLQLPSTEEWQWARALPHYDSSAVEPNGRQVQPALATGSTTTASLVRVLDRTSKSASEASDAGAELGARDAAVLLTIAESDDQVPPGCGTILRLDSARSGVVVRARDAAVGTHLVPELLGRQQAAVEAQKLHAHAVAAGLVKETPEVPSRVGVADIETYGLPSSGLSCVVGLGAAGPVELDLVADGPHALVGGTTGSGKSEFLVSWVLALAAAYDSSVFTVLLVDFKGGSAFAELERLPQCVGLLTDLDEHEAVRALASLRAELKYREHRLRALNARDISDPQMRGQMPRLVIVVDEFAAMLSAFPELHEAFVDIAARGRSLGMHLVLCTQRPGGVVRDALLANCSLRVSLRVNNREDSRAAIGSDSAALILPATPGRAFVAVGDGHCTEFQSVLTEAADLDHVLAGGRTFQSADAASGGRHRVRRPWLAPLPRQLSLDEVDSLLRENGGSGEHNALGPNDAQGALQQGTERLSFTLGVIDEPHSQRRSRAEWTPESDGPLLVFGAARSGRTRVLVSLAEQAITAGLPAMILDATDPERYWDALVQAATPPELTTRATTRGIGATDPQRHEMLLAFDDWDAVIARWPSDYQLAATELLGHALRESHSAGVHLVVATGTLNGATSTHRALFDSTLLLRLAEKSDHMRAGGNADLWNADSSAGRGEWRGYEVQCAASGDVHVGVDAEAKSQGSHSDDDVPLDLAAETLLIVSARPARMLAALRERLDGEATTQHDENPPQLFDLAELPPGFAYGPQAAAAGTIIVADPESWQSQWAVFSTLRRGATLVFDECRLSDYRALSRQRELPPLLISGGRGSAGPGSRGRSPSLRTIAVDADGEARRALL